MGDARLKILHKIGIDTVEDMLYYFPRTYEDRTAIKNISELMDGEYVCIQGISVSKVMENRIRKGLSLFKASFRDETGTINAVWYNQKFMADTFTQGDTYVLFGKVSVSFGKKEIQSPICEKAEVPGKYTRRIVPVYPLAAPLTQKILHSIIENCLKGAGDFIREFIPQWIRSKYNLAEINYALPNIHFPKDNSCFLHSRRRLVFEELFMLQLGLFSFRRTTEKQKGIQFMPVEQLDDLVKNLPFLLTDAQKKVVQEICHDIQQDKPMNRLVQGDVGSGKTVIALIAMYIAVMNGYQTAMMVPTEILAEQHMQSFSKLLEQAGFRIALLTGSLTKKNKNLILEEIKEGRVDIVIGTHALIQQGVSFNKLGLVVTDEQHRFGVKQRAVLASMGLNPHILVMSATPIPRTLALILYGDLDVSIIDQLPPGRKKVETYVVDESMRTRINEFLKKQLSQGRQAYIVCPLVEKSETLEIKSATEFAESLRQNVLQQHKVGLLHGKIKVSEKDEIMKKFTQGELDALVSTTVIEVGVNVPNATVMIIENAERFGLSQLHQLRGRVGRGEHQSYCILFNESKSKVTRERMKIMQETNDGFKISEKDLELRGPGDFFGTRQHGIPALKIANLFTDIEILKLAQEAAQIIVESDFELEKEEHQLLKQRINHMFSDIVNTIN